jgi:hypothetical protein
VLLQSAFSQPLQLFHPRHKLLVERDSSRLENATRLQRPTLPIARLRPRLPPWTSTHLTVIGSCLRQLPLPENPFLQFSLSDVCPFLARPKFADLSHTLFEHSLADLDTGPVSRVRISCKLRLGRLYNVIVRPQQRLDCSICGTHWQRH